MLHKFVTRNNPLLLQLAQAWVACGWHVYFLSDASGEVLWPAELPSRNLPTDTQIVGKEPLPGSWVVAPLRTDKAGVLGFIGVYAPDNGVSHPNLEAQAVLLSQVLAREGEINNMAAELMSTYDQLVTMYHISEATRSHLDVDEILRSLINEAMRLSKAQRGFVAVQRPDELHCVTCALPSPELGGIEEGGKAFASLLFQSVRERGQPLMRNTPAEVSEMLTTALKGPILGALGGVERCLVAPITVDGEVVAILGLLDKPTHFTAGDQKLLVALADEAGAIIERDNLQGQLVAQERLRRELDIAANIQTGLLPTTLPAVPGLDLAARCQPASEVGGDFYDFLPHPAGPLVVTLGDVTSKGIPAALFVTVTHTILHSIVADCPSPQVVLERLSGDMYDELTKAAMFVTLLVAYYHPRKRRLVVANAGHSPVLYYDARADRCQLWEADGPPVGVLPTILSTDQAMEPQPGDLLVVMSDGFNEMLNPAGEMFGIEPLMRLLEEHAEQSAAEIEQRLFEAVAAFAQGTPQADDLTICILKVTSE